MNDLKKERIYSFAASEKFVVFSFGKILPDFASGDNVGKKDPCEEKRIVSPIRQIQGSLKLGCKIKTQERLVSVCVCMCVCLAALGLSCSTWDLCCFIRDLLLWSMNSLVVVHRFQSTWASPTRDQTCIPCSARGILNHWATREVP